MRYIESIELREWVKENLRKTIFQKAHALATQTGCEILVKLHDVTDTTSHQYYASGSLQKAYSSNGLRKHPTEKFVSGETGVPLVDEAVQSEDIACQLPTDVETITQESFDNGTEQNRHIAGENQNSEEDLFTSTKPVLPLHLTVTNETPSAEDQLEEQETPSAKEGTEDVELPEGVQIKIEKFDNEPEETSMPSVTLETSTQSAVPDAFTDFTENMSMETDSSGLNLTMTSQEEEPVGRFSMPMSPKPYQCAMCQKAFRSVQVLQKHTQTFHMRGQGSLISSHRGRGRGHIFTQKRYQCVMCNRSFTHPDLLQDHMARSHMGRETSSSQLSSQEQQQQQPAMTFASTSNAPATATSAFNMDNSPGPFQLTDSSALTQSQPSTSGSVMQPGLSFTAGDLQMPSSSPNFQKRKLTGTTPYRYPRPGRPGISSFPTPTKSPGSLSKPQEFRKSFWQRGSTSYEIMRSLLRCTGPISTFTAFTQSGPPRLRSISKQAYNGAAAELQTANLGTLVSLDREGSISSPGRSPVVFVKSPPELAGPILEGGFGHMCSPEEFASKYSSKVPAKISRATRQKLIALEYVTAEQMGRIEPGAQQLEKCDAFIVEREEIGHI